MGAPIGVDKVSSSILLMGVDVAVGSKRVGAPLPFELHTCLGRGTAYSYIRKVGYDQWLGLRLEPGSRLWLLRLRLQLWLSIVMDEVEFRAGLKVHVRT